MERLGAPDSGADDGWLDEHVPGWHALELLPVAVVVADGTGRIRLWSSRAGSCYGWRADEVLGREVTEVFSEELAERVLAGKEWRGDTTTSTRDGDPLRLFACAAALGGPAGHSTGCVLVSEAVTELLAPPEHASELSDRLQLVLDTGRIGSWRWDAATGATDFDEGMAALFGVELEELRSRPEDWLALVHPADRERARGLRVPQEASSPSEAEFRVVWPDGSVRWLSGSGRALLAPSGELAGVIGRAQDVTDLVEARDEARESARLAEEAAGQLRRQRDRLAFLARINESLSDTWSQRDVMRQVAQAAIPDLGDCCSVHVLLDPASSVPEMEVAHVDPERESRAFELRRALPYEADAPFGVPRVIRTAEAEVYPKSADGALGAPSPGGAELRFLAQLGLRSTISVPLVKQGRVLGAMQFGSSRPDWRYSEEDLVLAQTVAGRVAASLENRRLAELQRHIARTLQESLLPNRLPSVPGVELAVRYWATGEGTEVGGDFYDVFALDDDAFVVVIGDVCGSGPQAAAMTSLARHNIRANAWRGSGPAECMSQLNEAILRDERESFCTVACARLVPTSGGAELAVVSAGHPLPVRVGKGGDAFELGHPGLLLGAFADAGYEADRVLLEPGDTVVFYTDGATDQPPPGDLLPEELRELVRRAVLSADGVEQAADAIAEALEELRSFESRHDDVAILVMRVASREAGRPGG